MLEMNVENLKRMLDEENEGGEVIEEKETLLKKDKPGKDDSEEEAVQSSQRNSGADLFDDINKLISSNGFESDSDADPGSMPGSPYAGPSGVFKTDTKKSGFSNEISNGEEGEFLRSRSKKSGSLYDLTKKVSLIVFRSFN